MFRTLKKQLCIKYNQSSCQKREKCGRAMQPEDGKNNELIFARGKIVKISGEDGQDHQGVLTDEARQDMTQHLRQQTRTRDGPVTAQPYFL